MTPVLERPPCEPCGLGHLEKAKSSSLQTEDSSKTALHKPIHWLYSVNQPPLSFSDIFSKLLGIFSQNFARLLYVHFYAGLQIFIQLSATLTKLCHHHMLKVSTIGRNARWVQWVVALDIV